MKKPAVTSPPDPRQAKTPVLHFRLARDVHSALKIQAARERRPMYRVMEDAVREYVNRHPVADATR